MAEKKEGDDRFNKFGTVSFTSRTKTNDFIDYLEKGVITGTRCKDCGGLFPAASGLFPDAWQATWSGSR